MLPDKKPVPPAAGSANNIEQVRKAMDAARNEKQKAVLLREAVRLAKERFWHAANESRKPWEEPQSLRSRRSRRKKD